MGLTWRKAEVDPEIQAEARGLHVAGGPRELSAAPPPDSRPTPAREFGTVVTACLPAGGNLPSLF